MTFTRAAILLSALPALAAAGVSSAADPGPPCTASTAACLDKVGQIYLAALLSHDGSKIPLAADVRRTENALTNAKGAYEVRESFARTTMVKALRDVRGYAEPAQGEIVYFFLGDIDLKEADLATDKGGGSTRAGSTDYKTALTVPRGEYTAHEVERFKISHGLITEIEIIAHVETGEGQGSGWPTPRSDSVAK